MEESYAQRRRTQGEETERAILSASLKLMRERGFDGVSVRDICKAAGITTGAFYHHFPSKEALLARGFGPMDDYMEEALRAHQGEPAVRRLRLILRAYAEFMSNSGELAGRYYQRRIADPNQPSMEVSRYTMRAMLACFQETRAEGILTPDRSPEWVTKFCFRHFRGVVLDWILHGYSYPLLPRMEEDYALFERLFRV